MRKAVFPCLVISVLILSACSKKTEDFKTAAISDYFPLQTGKFITYSLDSTVVYLNFGASKAVISYQVKYVVDSLITDNLGRPAYRIFRYIRKTPADSWQADNTFMAVPTTNGMELIENNFRYIKMKLPISEGYSWKGNSFIDTYSLNSMVKYLDNWDYTYDSLNFPAKIGALTIDSTLKVAQRDEVIGDPTNPNSYSEINYGEEKYAKGIGLVYRRFLHLEYQPPVPGHPGAYADASYGVTLRMIDHN